MTDTELVERLTATSDDFVFEAHAATHDPNPVGKNQYGPPWTGEGMYTHSLADALADYASGKISLKELTQHQNPKTGKNYSWWDTSAGEAKKAEFKTKFAGGSVPATEPPKPWPPKISDAASAAIDDKWAKEINTGSTSLSSHPAQYGAAALGVANKNGIPISDVLQNLEYKLGLQQDAPGGPYDKFKQWLGTEKGSNWATHVHLTDAIKTAPADLQADLKKSPSVPGDFSVVSTYTNAPPPWTVAQKTALTNYTKSFTNVQTFLRTGKAQGLQYISPTALNKQIADMRAGMRPLSQGLVVKRATGLKQFGASSVPSLQKMVGKTVTDKGFMSTTLNPKVPWQSLKNTQGSEQRVSVTINVPKGTPAAALHSISAYTDQNELLLLDGLNYKVVSVDPPSPGHPNPHVTLEVSSPTASAIYASSVLGIWAADSQHDPNPVGKNQYGPPWPHHFTSGMKVSHTNAEGKTSVVEVLSTNGDKVKVKHPKGSVYSVHHSFLTPMEDQGSSNTTTDKFTVGDKVTTPFGTGTYVGPVGPDVHAVHIDGSATGSKATFHTANIYPVATKPPIQWLGWENSPSHLKSAQKELTSGLLLESETKMLPEIITPGLWNKFKGSSPSSFKAWIAKNPQYNPTTTGDKTLTDLLKAKNPFAKGTKVTYDLGFKKDQPGTIDQVAADGKHAYITKTDGTGTAYVSLKDVKPVPAESESAPATGPKVGDKVTFDYLDTTGNTGTVDHVAGKTTYVKDDVTGSVVPIFPDQLHPATSSGSKFQAGESVEWNISPFKKVKGTVVSTDTATGTVNVKNSETGNTLKVSEAKLTSLGVPTPTVQKFTSGQAVSFKFAGFEGTGTVSHYDSAADGVVWVKPDPSANFGTEPTPIAEGALTPLKGDAPLSHLDQYEVGLITLKELTQQTNPQTGKKYSWWDTAAGQAKKQEFSQKFSGGTLTTPAAPPAYVLPSISTSAKKAITDKYGEDGSKIPSHPATYGASALGLANKTGTPLGTVLAHMDDLKGQKAPDSGSLTQQFSTWLQTDKGKNWATHVHLTQAITTAPPDLKKAMATPSLPGSTTPTSSVKIEHVAPGSDGYLPESAFAKPYKIENAPPPWTASQQAALKKYTGSSYITINGALRNPNASVSAATLSTIKNMQAGMRPIPKGIIARRGTTWKQFGVTSLAQLQALQGKTVSDPGFFSTTLNKSPHFASHGESSVAITIRVAPGTKAAYVAPISGFGMSENELILNSGTKFKVVKVEPGVGSYKSHVILETIPE